MEAHFFAPPTMVISPKATATYGCHTSSPPTHLFVSRSSNASLAMFNSFAMHNRKVGVHASFPTPEDRKAKPALITTDASFVGMRRRSRRLNVSNISPVFSGLELCRATTSRWNIGFRAFCVLPPFLPTANHLFTMPPLRFYEQKEACSCSRVAILSLALFFRLIEI